jgi:hypothetical protein
VKQLLYNNCLSFRQLKYGESHMTYLARNRVKICSADNLLPPPLFSFFSTHNTIVCISLIFIKSSVGSLSNKPLEKESYLLPS